MEPIWIDLMTSDVERSREFYGSLLGWTSEEPNPEFGGYVNFNAGGARVAGAMANDGSAPEHWNVYFRTDDIEKTVAVAVEHGATVHVPPIPVGDLGHMAFVTDPGGAYTGFWQPAAHLGWAALAENPGYLELHTRDYDDVLAFYRNVLSADLRTAVDMPGFRYTSVGEPESSPAGIMDGVGHLPDGAPSTWDVYFTVADARATADLAVSLGATVVMPPEDTPYGVLAVLTDPNGASFKLRQP